MLQEKESFHITSDRTKGARQGLIIANGEYTDHIALRRFVPRDPYVVCADGGVGLAFALGLVPHVVIGDQDSLNKGLVEHLVQLGAAFVKFPVEKDATDMELALDHVAEMGFKDVTIMGALGGRLDHEITNISLLVKAVRLGQRAKIVDERHEVFATADEACIYGEPGDVVSLISLTPETRGIHTSGLKYALAGGTLSLGSSLGNSNEMLGSEAHVRLADGILLVIHVRKVLDPPSKLW